MAHIGKFTHFYFLGPFATPLSADVNAFADVSGGDGSWPDLQILFVALGSTFDYGFLNHDLRGFTKEVF